MGRIENEIKEMIDDRYGGIPSFSKVIGIPQQTVYSVLRRGIINGTTSTVLPILSELGIDSNWILKNRLISIESDFADTTDVPLFGRIAAGKPVEMDAVKDTFAVPTSVYNAHPGSFLLRVDGESMNRILPNGCYALVDPCDEVLHSGMPYAVCVNGYDATVKRVRKLNNGFELMPDSNDPTYTSTVYNFNDPNTDTVTVIGEVVYYVLPYDWKF